MSGDKYGEGEIFLLNRLRMNITRTQLENIADQLGITGRDKERVLAQGLLLKAPVAASPAASATRGSAARRSAAPAGGTNRQRK